VLADTMSLYSPRRVTINQDGDYVFACYQRVGTSYQYNFLKLTSAGTTLTTILTSTQMSGTYSAYSTGICMESGKYLFNLSKSQTHNYSVLEVDDNGTFSTWAGGPSPNYGWYGYSTISGTRADSQCSTRASSTCNPPQGNELLPPDTMCTR